MRNPPLNRFFLLPVLLTALAFAVPGCGGDGGTDAGSADLQRMEGRWMATEFRVTSTEDSTKTFELVGAGGSFFLDIQASGRYAATLTLAGEGGTESGTLHLNGNRFTQTPTNPPGDPVTGTWSMPNDNSLILDGNTGFDFDFNGTLDPARAHIALVRR